MSHTRIPLILGAGQVGYSGRFSDPNEVQKWVDVMVQHGQLAIDTSRIYSEGTSEQLIAQLDLKGVRVDTKIFPVTPGDHAPSKLKELFKLSLEALGSHKIRVFYLHAPDRSVPFEDTLEGVNELYQQGHFEELGLSNYMSFEVAEIVGICKRRGFVLPSVYQGIYNVLDRTNEAELFPCLRKFNIRFAAYTVLAGGFLTGKLLAPEPQVETGSHFDPNWALSVFYTTRYSHTVSAVKELKDVAEKHGLKLAEVAYRWLEHHSAMLPTDRGIILGASRVEQLESAILDCEKGPLPEEVVAACAETWLKIKGNAKPSWQLT